MLPKRRRLSAAEVREVLARGRGRRGNTLSIKAFSTGGPFACAVVVSKKVAKSAVTRNRARRAVYRALAGATLPSLGHAILFVQVIPPKDATAVFAEEIKKLLNV